MSLSSLTSNAKSAATITVQRVTVTEDSEGFPDETYANVSALTSVKARVHQLSAFEAQRYGKGSDHNMTFAVYLNGDNDIRATDVILYDSRTHRVVEVDKRESPNGGILYTKAVFSASVNGIV